MTLRSVRRAGLTLGLLLASSCTPWEPISGTAGQAAIPPGWRTEAVFVGSPERQIIALRREPAQGPLLFRLIVIPGSGCTGFASFSSRYFKGLKRAQIIVLHKPYVNLFAGPAPAECSAEFVRRDALGNWRDDALLALRQLIVDDAASVPTIVLGISEGAEIAPYLLPAIVNPIGMVLLSATGLDPAVAGAMQAEGLGQGAAWKRLEETLASSQPDDMIVEGRSLRYWRDMFGWKLTAALAESKLPLLRVWGSDDALLPQEAYARFRSLPAATGMQICDWRLGQADHGLQGRHGDGVQMLWRQLERWAATGRLDCDNDMGRLR